MYFYSSFESSGNEIDLINTVLLSKQVTGGECVRQFTALNEQMMQSRCVLTNSGTSALLAAMQALDISQGSVVWTSALNFAATYQVASFLGAKTYFVDINEVTLNLSIDKLEQMLRQASIEGSLPDVLVVVHLSGVLQDMTNIARLSQFYGFRVIEDACHAYGASSDDGYPVGNCHQSDVCCFSFHGLKTISTGEGGLISTKNDALHAKVQSFVNLGLTRGSELEPWLVEIKQPGLNLRMSDISAAVGVAQFKTLQERKARREQQIRLLHDRFSSTSIMFQASTPNLVNPFRHLAVCLFPLINEPVKKLAMYETLRKEGIRLSCHYKPVYRHSLFKGADTNVFCPQAEEAYMRMFTIPCSLDMSDQELNDVSMKIIEVHSIIESL